MDVREKLVELLMQVEDNMCDDCGREPVGCAVVAIADHLIANGVTVQEWISVKDRLPEEGTDVLAYQNRGEECRIVPANYGCSVWFDCFFDCEADHITHWMPLPQPPKGE